MEKVKVNKEVFDALEYIGKWNYKDSVKLTMHFTGDYANERSCLNDLDTLEFAKCLILGYELEMTKEEKVIEFFRSNVIDDDFRKGVKLGILKTLELLEYEVDGLYKKTEVI